MRSDRSTRALFLDRDGVIIKNRAEYVRSLADVEFLPGAIGAVRLAAESGFLVLIVTNQSAVGRGLISLQQAIGINARVVAELEQHGGRVDGVYMCPHAPQEGCDCRKPRPGLIKQAASDLRIDLNRSILVGDALNDLRAAWAAGVSQTLMVETGRGKEQVALATAEERNRFELSPTLLQAVGAVIQAEIPASSGATGELGAS